jgi:hypothetical protein
MAGKWATIVPTQSAAFRRRVRPAAGPVPKISDGDVENSADGRVRLALSSLSANRTMAGGLQPARI